MERWAANTLRTLGIILVAGLVLLSSLLLLLLSFCAYGGSIGGGPKRPDQAVLYLFGAVAVIAVGILVIAKLARSISRAGPDAQIAAAIGAAPPLPPGMSVPLHLSRTGHKAVQHIIFALGAQVLVSAVSWIFILHVFWNTSAMSYTSKQRTLEFMLVRFVLDNIPYVVLIVAFLKRPDRRVFTYSLALPAVLILLSLFTSPMVFYFARYPLGILYVTPLLLNLLVLFLAYRAIQQVGLHPKPSSLVIAGVVAFVYFSFLHALTPFMYRFGRWP